MSAYESLLNNSAYLAESSPLILPDEITLQSQWFAGQFGRTFTTNCKRSVRIIQFGHWNRSAGPDFLQVAIELDGVLLKGPVELDTHALDWESHGHIENPAFDPVILHIVFRDPPQDYFTRSSLGKAIPRVVLPEDLVRQALAHPRFSTTHAHPGACSTPLADMPDADVLALLKQAALHRAQEKARKLQSSIHAHGANETLWQAVAKTLGYRVNALPFTLLSQRLSIRQLLETPQDIEPLLLGSAGFLESSILESAPADSRDYLRLIWDRWWQLRSDHEFTHTRSLPWKMGGARPVNHPHRRLGALCAVARNWRSLSHALREASLPALQKKLTALDDPFWSHHYTLKSAPTAKSMALIGTSRARDLIINVVAPLRLSSNPAAWESYAQLPASTSNEKLDKAMVRLFGKRTDTTLFTKKAWHQQALLQIYADFCLNDASDCADCLFPNQLQQWRS